MKRFSFLFFFLYLVSTGFAQGPGGVTNGLESWVKANERAYNNGPTLATDGQTVEEWKDNSFAGNDFFQAVNSKKPIYRLSGTGEVNFNPSLEFLGIGAGNETQLWNTTLTLDYGVTLFGVWFFQEQATTGSMHKCILVSNDHHGGGGTSAGGYLFATGRGTNWTLTSSTPGSPATGADHANPTQINDNFHIGGMHDENGTVSLYYDGEFQTSAFHNTNQFAFTSGYEIGAHENANASNATSRYYKGYVAEVIAFDEALNAADRRKVESYLAVKYGITLGINGTSLDYTSSINTTIWDIAVNGGYNFDIAGIALDNGSVLDQPKSHSINKVLGISRDIIVVSNGTNFATPASIATNQSYMMWGHNDLSINCDASDIGPSLNNENITERMSRIWKVQETGTVNVTTIEVDMTNSDLGNWGVSEYRLLVDTDDVFATGATSIAPSFVDVANNKLYFEHDFNGATGFFFSVGVEHIEIDFTLNNNTICEGEDAYLIVNFDNASGFADVTYSDGTTNTTVNNIANGDSILVTPTLTTTYSVQNPNNTNCYSYSNSSVTITVNSIPVAPAAGITTTYCDGDPLADLTATIGSGGTINWYDDATLTNNIGIGSTLTPSNTIGITDYFATETVGGCESVASQVTITINALPAAPIAGTDATYCDGDPMIDLTATIGSGGTINWFDDAGLTNNVGTGTTLTPSNTIGATTYFATETVAGCESVASPVTITINTMPQAPVVGTDAIYCEGDVLADLNATIGSGGTIDWYDDAGLTNNIGTGSTLTPNNTIGTTIYYATETVGTCVSPASQVSITIEPLPVITGESMSDVTSCLAPDGSITITSNGTNFELFTSAGVSMSNNATGEFTGLSSGDYYVEVSLGNCIVGSNTITINDLTQTSSNTINLSLCEGSSHTYADGTVESNITSNASHVSTLQNSIGCDSIITENITVVQSITIVIDTTICEGTNYTSQGDAASFVNVLNDFQHTSTLVSSGGCDSIIIENITVTPSPEIDLGFDQNLCFGESVQLSATTNGGIPLWSTGDSTMTITYSGVSDTFFVATLTDDCGVDQDTVFISVVQLPDVDAGLDQSIPLGAQAQLEATSSSVIIDYLWTPSAYLDCNDCFDPLSGPIQTTTYIVTVTDENGCTNSDSVTISIDGDISVYIPNIFSPNNDGENDLFKVYGPAWSSYKMQIYNRWGGLIFESEDQNANWNGQHFKSSQDCQQGVYVYKFHGLNIIGQTVERTGNVMLSR